MPYILDVDNSFLRIGQGDYNVRLYQNIIPVLLDIHVWQGRTLAIAFEESYIVETDLKDA